jgi:hypothetical protein
MFVGASNAAAWMVQSSVHNFAGRLMLLLSPALCWAFFIKENVAACKEVAALIRRSAHGRQEIGRMAKRPETTPVTGLDQQPH